MREVVQTLLESLVRFDSVNPSLDAKGGGEAMIGHFIAGFCDERGIQSELVKVEGERCNVLVTLPGTSSEHLLFVAHLDTVPAFGWTQNPFAPRIQNGRLYGRGACDTKGALAAMLVALASLRDLRPRATITVAGSVDEEYHKKGADRLGRIEPRFDGAVVGEPTDLELVVGHKGSVRWIVEAAGKAAHSALPERGADAIFAMAEALVALRQVNHRLRAQDVPLTGAPSLTVGLIEGGSDICTVPAHCRIHLDRRLVPGESAEAAVAEVNRVLAEVTTRTPGVTLRSVPPYEVDPPMSGGAGSRLAQVTRVACKRYAGTGTFRGVPYGTDGSRLAQVGIPTIVVGPGSIEQAHAIDEYIEIDQLQRAAEIYRAIMIEY